MKKILFLLFVPLFSMAQTTGLVIKGTMSGLKDSTTVFLVSPNDGGKTIASAVAKNGSFTLKTNVIDPDLFQLGFTGYREGLELFLQNETVTITGDANNLGAAQIQGSSLQKDFMEFREQLYIPYIDKLKNMGNAIGAEADTHKKDSLMRLFAMYKQQALLTTNLLIQNKPNSPIASLILFIMMPGFDGGLPELEARYAQLNPAAKKGMYARVIEKTINDAKATQAAAQIGQVGTQAVNFTQKDVNDKAVSLSSFKGKYVLVDFWASWCRPCRAENPNVVNAYNQFKNKNFTVLGVSLDQAKPNWLQAIQADNLTWTHVSDLQFWNNSVAQLYRIGSIPANMLIDPTGKIIARDLRGEDLTRKLAELLK